MAGADLIGELVIPLAEIIGGLNSTVTKPLSPAGRGNVTVTAKEITQGLNESVRIRFSGSNLDKKDMFGKSDPFFTITHKSRVVLVDSKQREEGKERRSTVERKEAWHLSFLSLSRLTNRPAQVQERCDQEHAEPSVAPI
jgi:hypothetical protein